MSILLPNVCLLNMEKLYNVALAYRQQLTMNVYRRNTITRPNSEKLWCQKTQ